MKYGYCETIIPRGRYSIVIKHAGAAQGGFTSIFILGWEFMVRARGASPHDVTPCSGISECTHSMSVLRQSCIIYSVATERSLLLGVF